MWAPIALRSGIVQRRGVVHCAAAVGRRGIPLQRVVGAAPRTQVQRRALHVQRCARQAERGDGAGGSGGAAQPVRGARAWSTGMKVLGSLLAVNVTVLTSAGLYVSTFAPDDATFAELDAHPGVALVTLPDGRKLEVKEYGPKTGRPVFVFHSTPGSLFDLELYGMSPERYAGGLGVRVVCVNRPGYGRSDDAPTRALLDWGDDVVHLANAMGVDKFAVMGFGGGGAFAMACAYKLPREHPGRLCGVGLVSSDGPYLNKDLPEDLITDAVRSIQDSVTRLPWSVLVYLRGMRVVAFKARDTCISMLSTMFQSSQPDAALMKGGLDKGKMLLALQEGLRNGAEGWYRDLLLQHVEPWGFELEDIKLDTGRVWLWHGEQDNVVPIGWGWYLASHINDCAASFPRHEGHMSLWNWRLRAMLEDVASAVPETVH